LRARTLLVAALILTACGPLSSTAGAKASPSPTPSQKRSTPTPGGGGPGAGGPYAIVVSPLQAAGQPFTLSLIDAAGKAVASASGTTRQSGPTCRLGPDQAALVVPSPVIVSASDSKVYFEDGDGSVKAFGRDGKVSTVGKLSFGVNSAAVFAVSPDDSRIAVVTIDASAQPFKIALSVGPLQSLPGTQIYSTTDRSYSLWPVGWHADQVVVARVPACTQGGGPFTGFPVEYHVVDAQTAARTATIGALDGCRTVSLPSPAGALCEDTRTQRLNLLGWDGRAQSSWADPGLFQYAVSPAGWGLACCEGQNGPLLLNPSGATSTIAAAQGSIGWIDGTHFLVVGQGPQGQSVLYDTSSKKTTPVAVSGTYLGRLPGGE